MSATTSGADIGGDTGPDSGAVGTDSVGHLLATRQKLARFVQAGVLQNAEVHFADALARSVGGVGETEILAAALALRATKAGHTRLNVREVRNTVAVEPSRNAVPGADGQPSDEPDLTELPWPDAEVWLKELASSPLTLPVDGSSPHSPHRLIDLDGDGAGDGFRWPFVLVGDALYLDRYRRFELAVSAELRRRLDRRRQVSARSTSLPPAKLSTAAPSTAEPVASSMPSAVTTNIGQLEVVQPSLFDMFDTDTTFEPDEPDEPDGPVEHKEQEEPVEPAGSDTTSEILDRFFGAESTDNGQRAAAAAAIDGLFTVIAGGPGTGKTFTIARVLATLYELDEGGEERSLSVALAAPTGKAAARLTDAVRQASQQLDCAPEIRQRLAAAEATTLYRLLGARHGGFAHDADNPLRHDVVIIDETSMVSLPDMARLLAAVRPQAKLILLGDPNQLESIEAGSVLGDIVSAATSAAETPGQEGLTESIAVLDRVHRFGADSAIAELADAIRLGDADAAIAILSDPSLADITWVTVEDEVASSTRPEIGSEFEAVIETVVDNGVSLLAAAAGSTKDAAGAESTVSDRGAAALARTRRVHVLCATRTGPGSVSEWTERIERRLARQTPTLDMTRRWYVGRPILIRANDPVNRLVNGDVGVIVAPDIGTTTPKVVIDFSDGVRVLPVARLGAIETLWAMTIHKSQGSEFDHVIVSLPHSGSRMLTRELLYTAVTRARQEVTIVASEAAIRRAISRSVARASGLPEALLS